MKENSPEHILKETLKQIVDNSPNYSDRIKTELKAIIDTGKSPEEICIATLTYLASLR